MTEAKAKSNVKVPAKFGPTFNGDFPAEMRRQLWPLCCGASILSGFKSVNNLTDDELVEQIQGVIESSTPDFQVFKHEGMKPRLTFLTLNTQQMQSKKIMDAIDKCGFFKIGDAHPRGSVQGFFVRDTSNSWTAAPKPEKLAA